MDSDYRGFWANIALVLGALPLGIYPFVLLANVMQLAAGGSSDHSAYEFLGKYFLLVSTCYPVIYLLMLRASRRAQKHGDSKRGLVFGFSPLLVVGTLLAAFWILLAFPPPSRING